MSKQWRWFVAASVVALTLAGVTVGAQQKVRPRGDVLPEISQGGELAPAEIQRLFDAYAVVQAQDMLRLDDRQYGQFVSRLKTLQEVRRRRQRERRLLLQELFRLADQEPAGDETVIRDRLRAFREQELNTAADVQRAYEGIDQVLNVRQQARFRMFEEQMERRKFDLLMRARQANRPKARPLPPR